MAAGDPRAARVGPAIASGAVRIGPRRPRLGGGAAGVLRSLSMLGWIGRRRSANSRQSGLHSTDVESCRRPDLRPMSIDSTIRGQMERHSPVSPRRRLVRLHAGLESCSRFNRPALRSEARRQVGIRSPARALAKGRNASSTSATRHGTEFDRLHRQTSPHGLKLRASPVSLKAPPTCRRPPLRGLLQGPAYESDQPLRGADFRAAYDAAGSKGPVRGLQELPPYVSPTTCCRLRLELSGNERNFNMDRSPFDWTH